MSNEQPNVIMYATQFCSYCMRARQLLDAKGVDYEEISVDGDPVLRREMESRSGRRTVPQIFVGDYHVGGYDDMYALNSVGELDSLLGRKPRQ